MLWWAMPTLRKNCSDRISYIQELSVSICVHLLQERLLFALG